MRQPLLALAITLVALPGPRARAHEEPPVPLMDNSFLIEEAYNQEAGVVQHILSFVRGRDGGWIASFTQEFPAPGQAHQLSYTLAAGRGSAIGLGDLDLNYRYQAVLTGRVAFAPRLTAVLATSQTDSGASFHGAGVQGMLPLSLVLTPWLTSHTNLGATWIPHGRSGEQAGELRTVTVGQSLVWLATPRFNVLLEALWTRLSVTGGGASSSHDLVTVSPGVRQGFDLAGEVQLVLGLAVPLGAGPSAGERAVLGYLSVELPYWHPPRGD